MPDAIDLDGLDGLDSVSDVSDVSEDGTLVEGTSYITSANGKKASWIPTGFSFPGVLKDLLNGVAFLGIAARYGKCLLTLCPLVDT